ncbi:MAG: hypothetical protein ACON5O_05115, partial [Lentimonas sp.]
MQSDEDELITLSKWPFYLGDILLVATALTIAILQDWNLSTGQIAACVAAVGLGAALFVLPFIVEFQIRVREEREDRGAELRVAQRQLKEHESAMETLHARIVDLERQSGNSAEATDVVAAAIEQKIAEIETFKDAQQAEIARLEKLIAGVEEKAASVEIDPKVTESIEVLEKRVAELSQNSELDDLVKRVAALEAVPAPVVEAPEEEEKTTKRPARSPRKRRKPEPRLLNRAIPEKEESAAAVSRIIKSKSKDESEEAPVEEQSSEISEESKEEAEENTEEVLAPEPIAEQTPPEPEPEPAPEPAAEDAEEAAAAPQAKHKPDNPTETASMKKT